MGYKTLKSCVDDLKNNKMLVEIDCEIDPYLEMGMIQRRVFANKGPAILFTNAKGSKFPMLANLFGTIPRVEFIFRDTLVILEKLFQFKINPFSVFKNPLASLKLVPAALCAFPKKTKNAPVLEYEANISDFPQLVSWPRDGGAYITLPIVYSESLKKPGFNRSNLGMYRVQLSGKSYNQNKEVGLHYQIHRGLGYHHAEAIERNEALKVNIFVGGPPAATLAAIMPLPENVPEIMFAGVLGGQRMQMFTAQNKLPIMAQSDFCICGYINPVEQKQEGPFGDHLGYYSLAHDFPVLTVEKVYHRKDAIWPFTTVGRPPQEDTMFGEFIHTLAGSLVPSVFPGVHEVHAVDAAGVHPLLLAIGSERYVPYAKERQPQELLTCAWSLFGNNQTSLSKYLLIAAKEDDANLSTHDVANFFEHILERLDLLRDIHFITKTTMDTLDYSGISLNQGSKAVWAVAGKKQRELSSKLPDNLKLPIGWKKPKIFTRGILIIEGPKHMQARDMYDPNMEELAKYLGQFDLRGLPLIVVVDDSDFVASNWENFMWVTFTRSDPATDTYGVNEIVHCKHWGCQNLLIDARLKTYHAAPLEEDSSLIKRIESLAVKGQPLHGLF